MNLGLENLNFGWNGRLINDKGEILMNDITLTRKEIDMAIYNFVKAKYGVDIIGLQFQFEQESKQVIEDLATDLVGVSCLIQNTDKPN
jgi:hypothetical protein